MFSSLQITQTGHSTYRLFFSRILIQPEVETRTRAVQ